jgi:hypothetical protein
VRTAEPADYPAVAELLNRTWLGHELYEPLSAHGLAQLVERLPEFDPADVWVLEEAGEVVACLGAWDWSRVTRVRIEALPLRLRLLGISLDFVRRFRPAPLLRAGETMRQWCAPIAGYRHPRDFATLLRHASNQALIRGGNQFLFIAERGHPILRATRGLLTVGSTGKMYLKPLQPVDLGRGPVYFGAIDL